MNKQLESFKEHCLWLWCLEQALIYADGGLEESQVIKLKEIDFPFEDYLKEAQSYMAKTECPDGEGICEGQHILCTSGDCDEIRQDYLAPERVFVNYISDCEDHYNYCLGKCHDECKCQERNF